MHFEDTQMLMGSVLAPNTNMRGITAEKNVQASIP